MSEKKYAIQDIQNIAASELLERVRKLKEDGYRLAQICAMSREYGQDILYSFDKDHILLNLKVKVNEGEEVESITGEYWPAFIYENEMHDLFGVQIKMINIDYEGKLYRTAIETPFK